MYRSLILSLIALIQSVQVLAQTISTTDALTFKQQASQQVEYFTFNLNYIASPTTEEEELPFIINDMLEIVMDSPIEGELLDDLMPEKRNRKSVSADRYLSNVKRYYPEGIDITYENDKNVVSDIFLNEEEGFYFLVIETTRKLSTNDGNTDNLKLDYYVHLFSTQTGEIDVRIWKTEESRRQATNFPKLKIVEESQGSLVSRAEMQKLEQQQEALEVKMAENKMQVERYIKTLADTEKEIETLQLEQKTLATQITELEQEEVALQQRLARLSKWKDEMEWWGNGNRTSLRLGIRAGASLVNSDSVIKYSDEEKSFLDFFEAESYLIYRLGSRNLLQDVEKGTSLTLSFRIGQKDANALQWLMREEVTGLLISDEGAGYWNANIGANFEQIFQVYGGYGRMHLNTIVDDGRNLVIKDFYSAGIGLTSPPEGGFYIALDLNVSGMDFRDATPNGKFVFVPRLSVGIGIQIL